MESILCELEYKKKLSEKKAKTIAANELLIRESLDKLGCLSFVSFTLASSFCRKSAKLSYGGNLNKVSLLLFGRAGFAHTDGVQLLERKQAALLAFLALEGSQPRSKLAGMLWANSTETTARNNLAQTLKRMREQYGELIQGTSQLRLQLNAVDALELEMQFFRGEYKAVAEQKNLFLGDLDFEDCPDFEEWMLAKRLQLEELSIEACALQAEALAPIDTQAALYWAEQYRQRRPESEGAYQRLMRLYHSLGDTGRMMQAFKQCQTMLLENFQATPSAVTLALLEQLQHNTASEQPLESLRQALKNHSTSDALHLTKLIEQSFDALGIPAQRLAQIAAVLEQDFTLERAALVLEQPVQQILPVQAELERREVLYGEQFVHERIFAVVRLNISPALLRYLHGRCAKVLEQTGGYSERIAQHWQLSGQTQKATGFFLGAARDAKSQYQYKEACQFFIQAANLYILLGDTTAAFDLLFETTDLYDYFDDGEGLEQVVKQLFDLTATGEQQAKAHIKHALWLTTHNRHLEAEETALKGLEILRGSPNLAIRASLQGLLSSALWAQGKYDQAIPIQLEVVSLNQKTGVLTDLATSYSNLASLYAEAQQPQKGLEAYEQALSIRMQLPDEISQAQTRINLASTLANIGLMNASLQHLELAFRVIQKADGATMQQLHVRAELGQRHFALGEYAQALEYFKQACQLATSMNHWALPIIQANQTYLLLMLGQIDVVKERILELKTNTTIPPIHKMTVLKSEIALCNFLGLDNHHLETEVRQCNAPALATAGILLELQRPNSQQIQHAQNYVEDCRKIGVLGRENYGLTKLAQALLQQNPIRALKSSTRAYLQHKTHQALGHFCNEINWVHYQALKANQHDNSIGVLQEAHTMMLEQHAALPPEYQESFLEFNPINKAILEATRVAGLVG